MKGFLSALFTGDHGRLRGGDGGHPGQRGHNPLTRDTVLEVEAVRNTLTLMNSCGMYNYSGQFAFKVSILLTIRIHAYLFTLYIILVAFR